MHFLNSQLSPAMIGLRCQSLVSQAHAVTISLLHGVWWHLSDAQGL